MKTMLPAITFASAMLVAMNSASGVVNCEQVRRYLATGRSAQDIADNMVIDISEVKKCQQEGAAKQAPTPEPPKQKEQ